MNSKKVMKYIFQFCTFLMIFMSLLMWVFASEYTNFNLGLTGACILCLGVIIYNDRRIILNSLKSSYFKNIISDSINIFLVCSIMGIVNYLIFKNNRSFDVTTSKVHTLTEQSKSVVGSFNEKVDVTLFAKRSDWENYFGLLDQYKIVNPLIKVSAVDIEVSPALAKVQGVNEAGSVVIKYKDQKIISTINSELDFTNALLKLQRSRVIKIGYTKGHGEIDFFQKDKNGGSYLRSKLKERNYQLYQVDLVSGMELPKDMDLLMVLGPFKGMLDLEVQKISDFLMRGGNLIFSLGPNFEGKDHSNLISLMAKYGVKITNTILLDRLSRVQGTDATIPLITTFNDTHTITKDLKQRIVFPLTVALLENKTEESVYTWLGRSSAFPASWAESNIKQVMKGAANFDKNDDIQGPVDVIAAIENSKTKNKIIVWASTASLVNAYQSNGPNFNTFLNSVSWAMNDEGLIALNRPGISGERIFLASSQITMIFWGAIVVVPFFLSALGLFFYRRKLVK